MATTSAIVEILVIGVIGVVWVILFLSGVSTTHLDSVVDYMLKLKDWNGLITFLVIGVLYQLGWLINGFSYGILNITERRIRSKIFKQKKLEHRKVRALVYQKASDTVRDDLKVDRSVIRLSRSGVFNFSLIFIALLLQGSPLLPLFPLLLFVVAGCSLQWYFRFVRYYNRMIDEYEVIKNSSP